MRSDQKTNKALRSWIVFPVILLILFLAGCGGAPVPSSPPPGELVPGEGQTLFSQNCATCHGAEGEGSALGPGIAGHSSGAVKAQVRNPVGSMPAFSSAQLTDSELEGVAEFVAGLAGLVAHIHDWESQSTETIHYWMALLAISDGNTEDAGHHLRDILLLVEDPARKADVEEVMGILASGDLHGAYHGIEHMAGTDPPAALTVQKCHLLLAKRGAEARDGAEVRHRLEHFLPNADGHAQAVAHEAMDLAGKGDFHGAEHEIEHLLSIM